MALTVVKCGGALLAQAPFELGRYVEPGVAVCIVHGAGGRITRALADAGVPSSFVNGRANRTMSLKVPNSARSAGRRRWTNF